MQRWFEFIQHHPILITIFAALLIAFFMLENRRSGAKISPQRLGLLANQNGTQVIDLRENKDYKMGHISGSRNIPFTQLTKYLDELKNHHAPIILVCQMGQTAGSAAAQLSNKQVYRLEGGIMNWKSAGLPLVKGK